MPKKKCKICNKFFNYNDIDDDIICTHCGVEYKWECLEKGWDYYLKNTIVEKCPICKKSVLLKRSKKHKMYHKYPEKYFVFECNSCKEKLFGIQETYKIKLYPFKYLQVKCEWCNNVVQIETKYINQKYIQTQKKFLNEGKEVREVDSFLVANKLSSIEELCICNKCHKKTKIHYSPWVGRSAVSSWRILPRGRKKKVTQDIVDTFFEWLNSNSSFQRYNMIHVDWIFEFSEQENYAFDALYDAVKKLNSNIFWPLDVKEIDINKYKNQFYKLVLKETFMTEGTVSLARMFSGRKVWKNTREQLLRNKKCTCEICGYQTTETRTLHAHEEWEFDGDTAIIKDIKLICNRCHACMHRNEFIYYRVMNGASGLVDGIPRADYIVMHLMWVNNVSAEVIYAYRKQLLEENQKKMWEEREKMIRGEIEDAPEITKYFVEENIINRDEIMKCLEERGLV